MCDEDQLAKKKILCCRLVQQCACLTTLVLITMLTYVCVCMYSSDLISFCTLYSYHIRELTDAEKAVKVSYLWR